MKCVECNLKIKYCDLCYKEIKNYDNIVHYEMFNDNKRVVLHICNKCFIELVKSEV